MRKPLLKKWNAKNEIEGLLFFAQCVEELLFHHTLDSFKSPALNTHLSVLELNFLASELFNNKVKPGALKPVLDELKEKIKTDPVVEDRVELYLEHHSNIENSIKYPDDLYFAVQALIDDIEKNYWHDLKRKIISSVKNNSEKKRIVSLASSLTSEIELQGYNKHFLYFMTRNFFFNPRKEPKRIDETTDVTEFLNIFNDELFEWQVVFRGSKSFLKFSGQLKEIGIIAVDKLPSSFKYTSTQKTFFNTNEKYPVYLIVDKRKAKDSFQVRKSVNRSIDFICDIFRFHDHEIEIGWQPKCVARKIDKSRFVNIKPPPEPMVRGMAPRIMSIDTMEQTINIMKGMFFDKPSIYIFRKALDYHRAAAETTASENQLVSLWAALEGFLPAPKENDGSSRITQLLNSILPSLTLSYVEKIFSYTSTCLKFAGNEVKKFIENVAGEDNFLESTILVLTSIDYEEIRICLYELLKDHPLLRYRCHWCHENFKSNRSIKNSLKKHRNKVSWHIQRIYTTRNQIVHSAQSLPYISTLIENLHSYFDILLNSVMTVGLKSNRAININTAMKTLEVHEKIYLKELEGEKEYVTIANYKEFLFGSENPINPLK